MQFISVFEPKTGAVIKKYNNRKNAFTLAEVLITLAVIGVVAVLSIGIFMPKIQDKVLAAQEKTAKIKFTKAMEQMALNNKIGPFYQDTEEFVSELQNYLKVAKVCDNEHLSDCFGYRELTLANGAIYDLNDLKDGKGFNLPKDDTSDFEGDTVGIVTIDGVPMVLAWNKKCEILEPGVYQWGNDTNKSTNCVAALTDVNGTKRPDKLGRDVALLNASNIGACVQFTVNGQTYKWGCPFMPRPLSYSECIVLKNAGKIKYCRSTTDSGFWNALDGDRWAGAVKTCGGTNKMPDVQELSALAEYLYNTSSIGADARYDCPNSKPCLLAERLKSLNGTFYSTYISRNNFNYNGTNDYNIIKSSDWFYIWSNRENTDQLAARRAYYDSFTNYRTDDYRYFPHIFAVCKL